MVFEELRGQQIGQYTLIEQVGVGGMGIVYRALDTQTGGQVAIKVAVVGEDSELKRRFQREAEVAFSLRHPHILPVLDFGQEAGRVYIVMPFVSGGTLADYLAGGGLLTPRMAVDLTAHIGSALDFAYSQGIVHRDVKPANIMLMDDGSFSLADFGIVKVVNASRLTAKDVVFGTAPYVSPEQAHGLPLDGRSDLYSLGVVLYEGLLGNLPFNADSLIGYVSLHLHFYPLNPTDINPDFPKSMEQVLLKALAKDPDQRYQTAGELAEALTASLSEVSMPDQPLVDPEQIALARTLVNVPITDSSIPPETSLIAPVPTHPMRLRRRLIGVAIALFILLLLAGLVFQLLIRPLEQRVVYAEQTANAYRLTPVVITQLVTQIITNEAGDPIYIEVEVTSLVTRIATVQPIATSFIQLPFFNRSTATPVATTPPAPTGTPTPRPPAVIDSGSSSEGSGGGSGGGGGPTVKPPTTVPPPTVPPPTVPPPTVPPPTEEPPTIPPPTEEPPTVPPPTEEPPTEPSSTP